MRYFRFSFKYNGGYAFRFPPKQNSPNLPNIDVITDFRGTVHSQFERCAECGELQNKWNQAPDDFQFKRYDSAKTYDGLWVVSPRFQECCLENDIIGLEFSPIDSSNYSLVSMTDLRSVKFDVKRRETEFLDQCKSCHQYQEIIGATPVFLKKYEVISPNEVVRTDLDFGSNDGKSPIILCGELAAETLMQANMSGFDLVPAND